MGRVARHVRVSGGVQGVFFRAWSRQQARSLGVSGWIRNCDDGSVEAGVEGEEHAVDELLRRMRSGPPDARVAHLAVDDAEPEGLETFEIRH